MLWLFVVEEVEVLMWNVFLHEMMFSFDENDENDESDESDESGVNLNDVLVWIRVYERTKTRMTTPVFLCFSK